MTEEGLAAKCIGERGVRETRTSELYIAKTGVRDRKRVRKEGRKEGTGRRVRKGGTGRVEQQECEGKKRQVTQPAATQNYIVVYAT